MSEDALARFVWKHLERKLAAAGVTPARADLERAITVVHEALPQSERGAQEDRATYAATGGATDEPPDRATSTADDGQTLTRHAVYFRRADVSVELNGNTGEVLSWSCQKLAEGSTPLTPAEAMQVAEAAGQPPPGALLIQHGYEDMAGTPVFVARWEHREDGVLVERDYLRVLVSGHSGRVFSIQRCWHAIDPDFTER
jgi:hypothetical protein